jgi:integrative and conjugative element protein (TIGR02256 family)
MIEYQLPEEYNCNVRFEDGVLEHFSGHKQLKKKDHEAGGQLFAEITESLITIKVATGPHPEDKRWRFMFSPSVKVEQEEIRRYFANEKLHYIGDWHTHPELKPNPSGLDVKAFQKTFTENNNGIFGILMVIVGTEEFPSSLYVALQTDDGLNELSVLQ